MSEAPCTERVLAYLISKEAGRSAEGKNAAGKLALERGKEGMKRNSIKKSMLIKMELG